MAKNYIIKEKLENGQFETLHPETNAGNVLVTDTHGALGEANASADLQDLADFLAAKALDDTTLKSIVIDNLSALDDYKDPDIYRFILADESSAFHLFVTTTFLSTTSPNRIDQYRTSAIGFYYRSFINNEWTDWNRNIYNVNGFTRLEPQFLHKKGAIVVYETGGGSNINRTCYMSLVDNNTAHNINDSTKWFNMTTLPTTLAAKMDTATANSTFVPLTQKGVANGIATLDTAGKVPASQLPSYVDDVLEYGVMGEFPATGETGKIYVAHNTNKTYRWSGSGYVEISASLALGETSSTAYAGDKGKALEGSLEEVQEVITRIQPIVEGAGPGSLSKLVERVAEVETVNNTQNTEIANIKNGTTTVGKSTTATKLATAQTINVKGDIEGSVSFDGSTAKELTLTLQKTGVTAGTYSAVSVNAKGQVTAGAYMIEVGAEGATAPTSNLAVGGIFFQHKS